MGNVSIGRLEEVAGGTDALILTWFKWRVRPSTGELKKVREQIKRSETVYVDDRQYELYKEVTSTVLVRSLQRFRTDCLRSAHESFHFYLNVHKPAAVVFMSPWKYIVQYSRLYCRSDYHYLAMFHKVPRPLSGRCTVQSIILFLTAQRGQRLGLGLSYRQLKFVVLTKQPHLCARHDQLPGDLLVQKQPTDWYADLASSPMLT